LLGDIAQKKATRAIGEVAQTVLAEKKGRIQHFCFEYKEAKHFLASLYL
jgi:sporulation protein YlmC with PRC-barrel domain